MSMIRIENLYKKFGKLEVLRGVNLTINKGEITAIIGRSGSGKTVLIKHVEKGFFFLANLNFSGACCKALSKP
ncbi:MAG: hypothetical protein KIIPBIDF_01050 [Candidatus Methanoperedenaceae archaeon GB50]|nr:MAG: hypothetical protein KIIPBIDF_01050 [Candidatus Methanoperedenaceae archaeon GB50]